MKKTILILGIIFLLVGISINSSIGISIEKESIKLTTEGNLFYVGGTGPGNYSKIKDAYDDANPGDTIFVYSGTYYEFLEIEKTINLIGEKPDTTFIIYNHKNINPILIKAPNVVVSGFTVYNPNPGHVRYITIRDEGNHASISNCIFYNSPLQFDDDTVGLRILFSSYNRISNCTFLYNDDEGIVLNVGSSHNIVENCVFIGCCVGIEFQNSSHNIVKNCIMKNCKKGITMISSIPDLTSNNNIITNCNIYDNKHNGIYIQIGYNNVIYNCSLNNNLNSGIYIGGKHSYNNLIVNNKISNSTELSWGGGFQLGWSCHNNTFSNNHISNCNNGVYIEDTFDTDDCNDNLFYHNNFIDNDRGAYDECNNYYDKGYPIGGNYWNDYTGEDNDGDGIGDTPYDISGPENNKDYYPLMEPWVTDDLTVEASGPYYGLTNESMPFHGLAVGGFKPYSWHWDFGEGNTSDEQNPFHTYTDAGKYDVVLTVTDNSSNSSFDTNFAWIQTSNNPPILEFIDGPTKGTIGISYDYTFKAVDPEGASVWLIIDWGDSSDTGWLGSYSSGQEVTISHIWLKQGTYTIKGRAKDPYDDEGPWGELQVTMPRDKMIYNSFLLRFLDHFPLLHHLLNIWRCNLL